MMLEGFTLQKIKHGVLENTRFTGWWFGTMEFYDFPETVGNFIIPTDFHSYFSEG